MKFRLVPGTCRRAVLAIAVLAIGGLAMAQAPHAWAGKQDFTLVNATGYAISELYVAPSKSTDWQEDVLGRDVLADGDQTAITFDRSEDTCKWDLRVVYEVDNTAAEWTAINLCDISEVTLKYNADTGETTAFVK